MLIFKKRKTFEKWVFRFYYALKHNIIFTCSIILEKLELLKGKKATSYPSFLNDVDTIKTEDRVVKDKNIITSKGAGTAFDFAYEIASSLGVDVEQLKKNMMYI